MHALENLLDEVKPSLNMPNRREHDHLVSKIVAMKVSRARAEEIVSGLSDSQISRALKDPSVLKAIIDVPTRTR